MKPLAARAKILIVDDHPLVREGLAMRLSLQADLEVCGEASTEDEALTLVRETAPDLVIVDLSLKSGHGMEVIKQIKARHPAVRTLVFSAFRESLYAERALRAGAMGYLNKQESNDQVLVAIRTILAGERYLSAELAAKLINQSLGRFAAADDPVEGLSDRELEIFRMIGEGLTNRAIAARLSLSPHTIDSHRENLKRKLQLKNAGELTRAAVEWLLRSS